MRMRRRRLITTSAFLAIGLSAGLAFAAEPGEPVAGSPVPMERAKQGEKLIRHTGNYEPLHVRWALNDGVSGVLAVFPNPQIAREIYLATEAGLLKSTDAGATFAALPECTADKIGTVNAVTFRPDSPSRFIIATQGRGLFVTSDGGSTVTQLATQATGLASDAVASVHYAADDEMLRTLIAVHGVDAPGLSRSTNGGKTWDVLFPDQHVHHLFWPRRGEKQVLLDASPADDADRRTLYFLASIQEPWQKLVADVLITGAASPRGRGDTIYLTTADQGIYRVAREGGIVASVTPGDEAEWSSIGIASGPTADNDFFYAYHAKRLGMVLFTSRQLTGIQPAAEDEAAADNAKPAEEPLRTLSDGLFTGPLVLEGAHIRAGANGNAFYAVVNRSLYQSVNASPGIAVTEIAVSPSSLFVEPDRVRSVIDPLVRDLNAFVESSRTRDAAAELSAKLAEHRKTLDLRRFVVTAKVQSVATDPVRSVTVDLSRVSRSAFAPLYDDGQHHDGEAGDGIYGNAFDLDFGAVRRFHEDWRGQFPGPIALTVSAVTQGQALSGAVGTLSLYHRRTSIPFATDARPSKISGAVSGDLTRTGPKRDYTQVISIKAPGSWAVGITNWRNAFAINREQVLSFYIRSSQPTSDGISIQLRDAPAYQRPNVTPKVDLMAEGFVPEKKLSPAEQHVLIPISRLLDGAEEFQTSATVGMILSGTATQQVDVLIRDIKLVPASAVGESVGESEGETP